MGIFLHETADIHKNTLDSKGLILLSRLLLGREVVSFVQVCPQTSCVPISCNPYYVYQIDYTPLNPIKCAINSNLSLMSLLHVSTSTRSSSGRDIQTHTNTENSVKNVHVSLTQFAAIFFVFVHTSLMMTLQRSKHVAETKVTNDCLLLIVQFVRLNIYNLVCHSRRLPFLPHVPPIVPSVYS